MKRKIAALALSVALALCAAGCSTPQSQINQYNAAVYVRGVLDETYTGAPQQRYLELVDRTQEQAQTAYERNVKAEYNQRLCLRFELDDKYFSKDLREDFLSLLDAVYQKAGYTVRQATPLGNGRYCVELSVTPITFFAAAYSDGYAQLREDFDRFHSLPDEERMSTMSAAQIRRIHQRYAQAWGRQVYEYLYARLDSVTTAQPVTKLVLVSPNGQGLYTLSATDLQDIDDLILRY